VRAFIDHLLKALGPRSSFELAATPKRRSKRD
jgi:hypothetical protein